eukprot:Opistho-2@39653
MTDQPSENRNRISSRKPSERAPQFISSDMCKRSPDGDDGVGGKSSSNTLSLRMSRTSRALWGTPPGSSERASSAMRFLDLPYSSPKRERHLRSILPRNISATCSVSIFLYVARPSGDCGRNMHPSKSRTIRGNPHSISSSIALPKSARRRSMSVVITVSHSRTHVPDLPRMSSSSDFLLRAASSAFPFSAAMRSATRPMASESECATCRPRTTRCSKRVLRALRLMHSSNVRSKRVNSDARSPGAFPWDGGACFDLRNCSISFAETKKTRSLISSFLSTWSFSTSSLPAYSTCCCLMRADASGSLSAASHRFWTIKTLGLENFSFTLTRKLLSERLRIDSQFATSTNTSASLQWLSIHSSKSASMSRPGLSISTTSSSRRLHLLFGQQTRRRSFVLPLPSGCVASASVDTYSIVLFSSTPSGVREMTTECHCRCLRR